MHRILNSVAYKIDFVITLTCLCICQHRLTDLHEAVTLASNKNTSRWLNSLASHCVLCQFFPEVLWAWNNRSSGLRLVEAAMPKRNDVMYLVVTTVCMCHWRATVCYWEMSWCCYMLFSHLNLTTARQNSASHMACVTRQWLKFVNCGVSWPTSVRMTCQCFRITRTNMISGYF